MSTDDFVILSDAPGSPQGGQEYLMRWANVGQSPL